MINKHFQENKSLLAIIIVGLFLLELEILALAAMTAGDSSVLQVIDSRGIVIHQSSGKDLSDFNRQSFEQVFGPLDNYTVQLKTHKTPFPFRAWFVASICVPIGAMMLFGFIVKAYLTLFHGESVRNDDDPPEQGAGSTGQAGSQSQLDTTLNRISRMNIFNIGFLIFVGVVSYWIVPNALTYLGHIGIDFFVRFKWVYIGVVAVLVCVILWVVYLRYLLAKKSIESQTELQKHRLSLEYHSPEAQPLLLDEPSLDEPQIIEYKPDEASDEEPPQNS